MPGEQWSQCPPHVRPVLSLRQWHELVVVDNNRQELILAIQKHNACLKTIDAASFLTADHGIGPYLTQKHVIATMLSHGFRSYDVGIVGPGSLATVTYLCGGSGTLKSQGLLPTCADKTMSVKL